MGEIADALRRARGEDPHRPRSAPVAVPGRRPAPVEVATAPQQVEELEPRDEAIVVEDGPNAEACRQLAVRVRAALEHQGASTLAIVSGLPGEGKTTVTCDLSVGLASLSSGREVAMVDLDLRRSSLAGVLGIRARRGIEDVLTGRALLSDVRVQIARPCLDVYPVAHTQQAAHELLALPAFGEIVEELRQRYAIVLFDTPPALLLPDTSLILRKVEACLPIARAGKTRARHFRSLVELLPRSRIIGELLNGVRASRKRYDDYYYRSDRDDEAADEKRGRGGRTRGARTRGRSSRKDGDERGEPRA